jgi:hypothetical protein
MSLLTGLESYWKLAEASGNALDAHGSNTLTETSGTIDSAAGRITGARDFEAADTEYFTIADNASLSTGDIDFTISLWVNLESLGTFDLVSKWITTGDQREFRIGYGISTANRFQGFVSSAGTSGTVATVTASNFGAASTGAWHLVRFEHHATLNHLEIQIDDTPVNRVAYSNGVFDSTSPFQLGWIGVGTTTYFDGLMCEVGFWKRALTDSEKLQLYNGDNGWAYEDFGKVWSPHYYYRNQAGIILPKPLGI